MFSRSRDGWYRSSLWPPALSWPGTSPPGPETPSLELKLKHCEDPVVIEDGDSPPDQEQERLPAEAQSDLAKSQDTQSVALAPGPGLPSRPPGQLSGEPGTAKGVGEGHAYPTVSVFPPPLLKSHELCWGSGSFPKVIQLESDEHVCPLHCVRPSQGDHCPSLGGCISGSCRLGGQPVTITQQGLCGVGSCARPCLVSLNRSFLSYRTAALGMCHRKYKICLTGNGLVFSGCRAWVSPRCIWLSVGRAPMAGGRWF